MRAGRAAPADDDVRGALTPGDRPFFLSLALTRAGLIVPAPSPLPSGTDGAMAVVRR